MHSRVLGGVKPDRRGQGAGIPAWRAWRGVVGCRPFATFMDYEGTMVFLISAFVMAWTVTTSPAPAPEPESVELGVDCGAGAAPFTTSLPPDVVIVECEPKFD